MTKLRPLPSSLADTAFTADYGGVYEASPWVAEAVFPRVRDGALDHVNAMQAAMREVVDSAGRDQQMVLLRTHPELAGRAAIAGDMTEDSKTEQQGAGLDQCSPEEFAEFITLNARYDEKFGFPFIIAVKGHNRRSILIAFRKRIENDVEAEFKTALEQIHRIAAIRLSVMAAGGDTSKDDS